jgi:hypothetical protein
MNMRTLLVTSALVCAAFAGAAQAADTSTTQPVPYTGQAYHVKKVISMTEQPTSHCREVNADMKYIDDSGKINDMTYRKMSTACDFQN